MQAGFGCFSLDLVNLFGNKKNKRRKDHDSSDVEWMAGGFLRDREWAEEKEEKKGCWLVGRRMNVGKRRRREKDWNQPAPKIVVGWGS